MIEHCYHGFEFSASAALCLILDNLNDGFYILDSIDSKVGRSRLKLLLEEGHGLLIHEQRVRFLRHKLLVDIV